MANLLHPRTRRGAIPRTLRALPLIALVASGACSDRTLTGLDDEGALPEQHADAALVECRVEVRAETMRCAPVAPKTAPGLRADMMVGGQDMYVKLTSSGTAYDAGSGVLSASVTVQNLTHHMMGSSDGLNMEGMRVFFHYGPAVTAGSGQVTVANPDGYDLFTASNQPYFAYGEMLEPLQISNGREWQFQLDPEVVSFAFLVYVAAPMTDESTALLGSVWTGAGADSDWLTPLNWRDSEVPDSTIAATVPNNAMIEGAQRPTLSQDGAVLHLRVGTGSTLDLEGHTLRVYGNVDALGTVSDGTLRLRGAEALMGGALPNVAAEGATHLQRATRVTGTLTVTGSVSTQGLPLTIAVP